MKTDAQKSSSREYYGFVLYITTIVFLYIYFIWVIFGETLDVLGFQFPNRKWALVVPIWIVGLIPFTIMVFYGKTLIQTRDLDSIDLLTDNSAKIFMGDEKSIEKILNDSKIPALQDVPLSIVNQCWRHELTD
jgi:phosphatidylinositol glycan class P protein